jgi:uncharacterized protein
MASVRFQPIPDIAALYLPKERLIVLADLHIGIENELKQYGVHVSSQTENMKKRVLDICENYKISDFMILGDVKHTIPSIPFHEKKELYQFLTDIQQYGIVHIIPGNHDGGIVKLVPDKVQVHTSAGIIKDDIGFIHGHRWPHEDVMNSSFIIMGHTHPTVMLKDRLGFKTFEPCWLKCPANKDMLLQRYPSGNRSVLFLILPAFNRLCGGLAVNEDGIIGPIASLMHLSHSEIYLLEGTNLGEVRFLTAPER